ncbi:MAG: hypothetical protein GEU96_19635 [Propionibacteriales bacterium]|nr:hypothetical protein [Propionibacteriales bacterium]
MLAVTAPAPEHTWPGRRYGLPQTGHGAVATWPRRALALAVDWVLALLFVGAFVGSDVWGGGGLTQWAPLAVFAVERWVLTSLSGGSAGQLVCGIRVVRTSRAAVDPLRVLVRTALICLVLPAVIYNQDRQGLHDLAVDTVAVLR